MSSVLKFVEQLVQETSPADDFPRLEMQKGGLSKRGPGRPVGDKGGRPTLADQDKFYDDIDNTIKDEALSALSSLGISKNIVEKIIFEYIFLDHNKKNLKIINNHFNSFKNFCFEYLYNDKSIQVVITKCN